jgi:hypothetical protein
VLGLHLRSEVNEVVGLELGQEPKQLSEIDVMRERRNPLQVEILDE